MQHQSVVLPNLYLTTLWNKRFGRFYDTAFEFSKLFNLKLSHYSNWNEFPSASAHWHLLVSSVRSETCVHPWESVVSVSGKEQHKSFLQQTTGNCFLRTLVDQIEYELLKKFYSVSMLANRRSHWLKKHMLFSQLFIIKQFWLKVRKFMILWRCMHLF